MAIDTHPSSIVYWLCTPEEKASHRNNGLAVIFSEDECMLGCPFSSTPPMQLQFSRRRNAVGLAFVSQAALSKFTVR